LKKQILHKQLIYLEAYHLEIGLLINFGEISLKVSRLENKKYNQNNQLNHSKSKSIFKLCRIIFKYFLDIKTVIEILAQVLREGGP
jgi:hypothetical protein